MRKEIDNNIKEVYCSQEVSNLLKAKGCLCWDKKDYLDRIKLSIAIEWIRINFETDIWAKVRYSFEGRREYEGYSQKINKIAFNYHNDFISPNEALHHTLKCTLERL